MYKQSTKLADQYHNIIHLKHNADRISITFGASLDNCPGPARHFSSYHKKA